MIFQNKFQVYPHSLHDPLAIIAYDDPAQDRLFVFFLIYVGA